MVFGGVGWGRWIGWVWGWVVDGSRNTCLVAVALAALLVGGWWRRGGGGFGHWWLVRLAVKVVGAGEGGVRRWRVGSAEWWQKIVYVHIPSYSFIFLHGSSWFFMVLHGSSWFFMVLHGSSYSFI